MSYTLHWIEKEFYDYYVSGAITKDFNIEEQNKILLQLVEEKKDIMVVFEDFDRMLLLKGFSEYKNDDEEEALFGYLLDEGMIETIEAHSDEKDLSLMIGIIALQYFQFDTLEDIIMLDEDDLASLDEADRAEIEDIQAVFKEMPEEEREKFLEQELFYYDQEELKQWMQNHQ